MKYGNRAFSNAAQKLWNVLRRHIKAAHLVEQFKILLKTHLFQKPIKIVLVTIVRYTSKTMMIMMMMMMMMMMIMMMMMMMIMMMIMTMIKGK